jgi:GTP cyclohydrolase IA
MNRPAMRRAVKDFLVAAGMKLSDPNLTQTPARVTEAWADEFLDGYGQSAAQVLGERFPVTKASQRELVVVTGLHFRSMCPHHLLPYSGRATVAYLPGKSVVGFGKLASLVDLFAHRLILQEELARLVALALKTHLKSPATACVLEAEQTCLRLRGGHQHHAVTHAEAYEGTLRRDSALRRELWARIGKRAKR